MGAYGDRAYRLAMRITGGRPDAEVAVQDTLMAATRNIDTFRGAAAFGSWIYRLTANGRTSMAAPMIPHSRPSCG